MSISADAEVRINRARRAYEQQLCDHRASQRANGEKIERLRQARNNIRQILDYYQNFSDKVHNGAKSMDAQGFRGDLRKKFEDQSDRLADELKKQKNRHQENAESIERKIGDLELENSAVGDLITNVKASIGALAAGLF